MPHILFFMVAARPSTGAAAATSTTAAAAATTTTFEGGQVWLGHPLCVNVGHSHRRKGRRGVAVFSVFVNMCESAFGRSFFFVVFRNGGGGRFWQGATYLHQLTVTLKKAEKIGFMQLFVTPKRD